MTDQSGQGSEDASSVPPPDASPLQSSGASHARSPDASHRFRPRPGGARSLWAVILGALLVVIGLIVHVFVPDSAASDIAGDALYAALIYAVLVFFWPWARSLIVGSVALGWCLAVELFQLTGIPESAGQAFFPAVLVLGTVFDPRDAAVYGITVVFVTAVDRMLRPRRNTR